MHTSHAVVRRAVVAGFFLTLAFSTPSALASGVQLEWTAPGDDGMLGRATRYDVRYSTSVITAANFASATPVAGVPAPAASGTLQSFTIGGLQPGRTYYFAIKTVDEAGNWSLISNVLVQQAPVTGVASPGVELSFSDPWPNPAHDQVRCAFAQPAAGPVRADVYDITGRHLRTVAGGWREAGRGEVSWDLRDDAGRGVETGMYLMRARLGGREWTRRILVVR